MIITDEDLDQYRKIQTLTYERDRARMLGDSAAALAEQRMFKIFELEKKIALLEEELSEPAHCLRCSCE